MSTKPKRKLLNRRYVNMRRKWSNAITYFSDGGKGKGDILCPIPRAILIQYKQVKPFLPVAYSILSNVLITYHPYVLLRDTLESTTDGVD